MEPLPEPRAPVHLPGEHLPGIAQVLAISDELAVHTDLNDMLRRAVELGRDRLKLERLSIFLHDDKRSMMHGTFGTGASGQTVDERWHSHSVAAEHCEQLKQLAFQGRRWWYLEDVELQVPRPRRTLIVGRGWNTVTPLLAAGKVVGVMYADAALSGSAFDTEKQAQVALVGATVANLIHGRRLGRANENNGGPGQPSRIVRRAIAALERDAGVRGQDLAREFGVSPGHLARIFKNELGVSFVEYRNRLRLRGFFSSIEQGEANLIRASRAAGFGSYAQFYRVYRQLLGGTPRDLISSQLPKSEPRTSG